MMVQLIQPHFAGTISLILILSQPLHNQLTRKSEFMSDTQLKLYPTPAKWPQNCAILLLISLLEA
jgi:hypothetical protein